MDYKNNLYLNNLMTFYELKILLKILLLKLPRVSVSLINFIIGKELKVLAPRKAKALCPVANLHLGNASSLFVWYLFGEFLNVV